MLAHASLNGAPLSVETAELAIRDLVRLHEPKRVKIEDIQKLVATHFNVSRADILSSRRTANVVRPRQIAMYLSKALTLRSLPEIGRRFGGRDHTTVLHAVRKIDALAGKDAAPLRGDRAFKAHADGVRPATFARSSRHRLSAVMAGLDPAIQAGSRPVRVRPADVALNAGPNSFAPEML